MSGELEYLGLKGAVANRVVVLSEASRAFSASGGSSTFQTLSFANQNNVTFSNSNGSVVASFSQSNPSITMYATGNTTQNSSTVLNASSLIFNGGGNITVGFSNGSIQISQTGAGGGGITNVNLSAGTTSNNLSQFVFSNSNNVSFGLNGSTVTASASFNQSNQTIGFYATGNSTQNSSTTLDARSVSYNAIGGISLGYSNGSVQVSAPSVSSLSGTGKVSISANAGTISIGVPNDPYLSSYANLQGLLNSSALTWNGTSLSHAAAFLIPENGSFSFMRIPTLFTTNSTTIATLASASASAQGGIFSTVNAVIYSLGVGANSQSLQSVVSGSAGFSFTQQISVTNSTQASYSLGLSGQANGAGTSLSTQYSVSNTNYSFTTNAFTNFTSARMLDLPFANSLTAGPYWIVLGMSSSSSSAGAAGLAALTNCNVRYSAHYGVSQANIAFGIFGNSNMTSGGLMGAGSFSTAGGATTASINISAISSVANLAIPYFQLLRSA